MNFPKLLINWFDILGRSVLHITVYNLNLAEVNSLINMGIAEKLINIHDDHKMTFYIKCFNKF